MSDDSPTKEQPKKRGSLLKFGSSKSKDKLKRKEDASSSPSSSLAASSSTTLVGRSTSETSAQTTAPPRAQSQAPTSRVLAATAGAGLQKSHSSSEVPVGPDRRAVPLPPPNLEKASAATSGSDSVNSSGGSSSGGGGGDDASTPPKPKERPPPLYTGEHAALFEEGDMDDFLKLGATPGGDGNEQQVMAGSPEKLVLYLTHEKHHDPRFASVFLLTYHAFSKPLELLEALGRRYDKPPPPDVDREQWKREHLHLVRIKVVNVIKTWLKKYYYEFSNSTELKVAMVMFVQNVVKQTEGMNEVASAILVQMEKQEQQRKDAAARLAEEQQRAEEQAAMNCVLPFNLTTKVCFRFLDTAEVANQLTLIEFDLYKRIEPKELLYQRWTKKNKYVDSPNVIKLVERFNYVSNWVCTEIVLVSDLDARMATLAKFLAVAEHMYRLNNLNGVMEIVSGLQSSSVFRLKRTWDRLDAASQTTWQKLQDVVKAGNNFASLRAELKAMVPPTLPYLGIFLTDLIFIDEANPTTTAGGLINFNKLRLSGEVILNLMQFQQTPFVFAASDAVQEFLRNATALEEKEMYKQSLEIEPRAPKNAGGAAVASSDAAASKSSPSVEKKKKKGLFG